MRLAIFPVPNRTMSKKGKGETLPDHTDNGGMVKRPGRKTLAMPLMPEMACSGAGALGDRKKRRKKGRKETGQG